MSLWQKRQRWQTLAYSKRMLRERIAVLSTFTANPIIPYLGLALNDAGLPADVWIGPYNQMAQQCLDERSETAGFKPTILIGWARLEELWSGRPLPLLEPETNFVHEALELADILLNAARHWQATLIFVLPAIPEERPLGIGDACNVTGVFAIATSIREALRHRLAGQPEVLLFDLEEVIRSIGSASSYNQRLLALAHIPFTEELFHLMSEHLARLILLSRRPARKVIVLDGDNTLWGGIVGEDGALGVDLNANGPGASYREFQSFLLELRRAGVLLTLCSKNEEADVWEVFARPEMRLKPEMLSAWRIGWQPKPASIRELADDLKLGIESFVLIDDNAAEIAEVRAAFPQIACIQMPADPAGWLTVLTSAGLLDRLPPLPEDLERAVYYQQEQQRAASGKGITSPEVYLGQLNIEVAMFSPTVTDMPRLTQLVAKTNQFNLNCRRRSAPDLSQLCADEHYIVRLTRASDRFGDYGIVGACIARLHPEYAELDTFIMSCRVMGRGIERAMLNDLFAVAAEQDRTKLVATVEECPRNEPARTFFYSLGCETLETGYSLQQPEWPSYIGQQEQAVDRILPGQSIVGPGKDGNTRLR
ncbi:methoxymalonyl-ACP biosynthesis protein FkbH [Reticulibacter mediterranei]|uniref:Methoxymalonyl-ACP biosynthesis protein FkbH n=1 Tax=Reticulibacter mediterranei TaxID=2778369 RepID=A0A8J3N191_9CHLR|nr:HAD-IIIC family phosphatase [Reticulibacter mediterranei]GHO91082.1 methoxymalonyl-ACP biosynthesis protein FkbH [Reticulibacter mediterranei]